MAAPVWLMVGLSAVVWWQVMPPSSLSAIPAVTFEAPTVQADRMAAWLESGMPEASAPPPLASRYQLRGLIAQSGAGVALLSVQGGAARPYQVGSVIEEGVVLRSVGQRYVDLETVGERPIRIRLELPALASSEGAPSGEPIAPPR
jgi:general secretion pathway protein C